MIAVLFNDDWRYRRIGEESYTSVTLPHDAMMHEPRTDTALGEHNIGWFESYDYEYVKNFDVPKEWENKTVCLEFEGVYKCAEVFVNGEKAVFRPYGYIDFTVNIGEFLRCGESNEIKVVARNADQPNSRWYSGSGIYRNVNLFVADKKHIEHNGLRIKTLSVSPARVEVSVKTSDGSEADVEIIGAGKRVCASSRTENGKAVLEIADAKLWSPSQPYLYECNAKCGNDKSSANFGIRTITCTPEDGFKINGERVILNGACIHHDNGLLGACAYKSAEERKIRLLKEIGYNAVRSAHNPCSKALLDACDRMGMLVMDEYVDVWYIHKTEYDYVNYFSEWWDKDLKEIVDKDYNHPSVILYSTGNEVSETAQKKGIEWTKRMTDYLHSLDDTRPVTCGINIFFNYLSSMGFGVYSDKKAEKAAKKAEKAKAKAAKNKGKKKKKVGSEFFNTIAGLLGDKFMKWGATLHGSDVKTRDAFANMDVAGYNYGIDRYKKDLKRYPNRLILGSETFCKDTFRYANLAKDNPRIIGDFVWAGMDYLGEAGIGAWEYKKYAPAFGTGLGWITAGSGRLDITGRGHGEAAYTKVMYGLEKIAFAVVPVDTAFEKHSPSAWKMTNAETSWSWEGCDGKKTKVEVYSRDFKAALVINGKRVGVKKIDKNGRAVFKTRYRDGEATAIAYDEKGNETARTSMRTAGKETKLTLLPESDAIKADELAYVRIAYTDNNGEVKPLARADVKVKVEGGELLGLGTGCSYTERSYLDDTTDTYYGEALAIIKPTGKEITVFAESKYGNAVASVKAD